MAITRGIKNQIDKYGVNLPTDKRTRAYSKLLRDNNWTEAQYASYLKQVLKRYTDKERRVVRQVQQQNFRQQVAAQVAERNKVRYVGSTSVRLVIMEDKSQESDGVYDRLDTFKKREPTANRDVFIEWHDIPFDKRVSGQREIDIIVNEQVSKLVQKVSNRPYVIDVDVDLTSKSIHRYSQVPLANVRMRQSGSLNIDEYDPQPWDKQTDKCVYDYIIHTYGNIKGFKKVCNYDMISEVFEDDECFSKGVNSWNIRKWCMEYDVPMSAFDDRERRFLHYTPIKRNKHAPSMLYRVSDGHFYPIPESKRKSLITIATQIDSASNVLYNHVKETNEDKNPITDVVVLENTCPLQEVGKYMMETNTKPTRIVVNDGNLKSFKINDTTYTVNQFIPITKELCANMAVEYTGQSMGSILKDIIKETIGELKISHHNPSVFDSLIQAKKNRVHTGLVENKYKELLTDENTIARDINKHYTSVMYQPLEEWIRYDFNDKWTKYDAKLSSGGLSLGLYYVRTDDTTLFRKTDVYSSAMIEKARKENINHEITHQLIPSYKENANTFQLIIDKIMQYSKGNKEIYKLMINMMSGMLAKTECTMGKYHINSNIDQIFAFIREYPDMTPVISRIPNTDHYLYGAERKMSITENNLGMYVQVLDQSNIKLYDMVKKMGGTLIARKVDCAVVHYHNEVPSFEDSDVWGGSRKCKIPTIKNVQEFKEKDYRFINKWIDHNISDSDEWEKLKDILVKKGGLLLQADAGCGKTYAAKKIASVLEGVKNIAPTNKAALNLRGSTIHKFLSMDMEGNISTAKMNYIKKNIQYIIVDEISMITKELWRRLTFVKRSTGVKFLLLGDDKQLPPVEDEKIQHYFNHPAVKYLCNNNRNILSVKKRFNPKLANILDDVENINIKWFPFRETPINMAYTHKTRKSVNKKWNDKLRTENNTLYIPVRENDKKYGQDMYIYSGCPLIARENDNKHGLYMNNETFDVVDYDDKNVYLITERPNENGEPEVHTVEVEHDMVQKLFYLNYCSTIHKYQGTTIKEAFTIWDWNHPCMSKKAKYTALSRGTCPENISIVGDYEEDDYNDKKIMEKLIGYLETDKAKGFDNDLTVSKVKRLIQKQHGTCNICNCDLKFYYEPNDRTQFSIDRIDSRKGHLCSNVQVLCWGCNSAKGARF